MFRPGLLDITLSGIRVISYSMLAYSIFYLAVCLGEWYAATIFSPTEDTFGFQLREDATARDLDNQIVTFVGAPIILAAALGGLYEALWKLRECRTKTLPALSAAGGASGASLWHQIRSIPRFKFRPVIGLTA